jgi:hypothetical protein
MPTKEWMEVQYKTEMEVINHGTADNNPGEDEVAINHGEEEVVLEEVHIIEVENKFFRKEMIIVKKYKEITTLQYLLAI